MSGVVEIDEVAKLVSIVDRAEVLEDFNRNGVFEPEESTFVVDPSESFDKAIRISFLEPVPRAALEPIDEFVSLEPSLATIPLVEIESVTFEPRDSDEVTSVLLDISDDLESGTGSQSPFIVRLHPRRIDSDLPDKAVFVFVVGRGVPVGLPPRVVSFEPSVPGLPGWSRPLDMNDLESAGGLSGMLALLDQNFVGAALEERVSPHDRVEMQFDSEMANVVADVTPNDPVGVQLKDTTLSFFTPFESIHTETSAGLAPDTQYTITPLSKWSMVNVPIAAGTQDNTADFLIPFMTVPLYYELTVEQGLSKEDLAIDTPYRFRTGPVRVTEPPHNSDVGLGDALGGLPVTVQFAQPADAPPIESVRLSAELDGRFFGGAGHPFSGVPDTISQGDIVRTAGVSKMDLTFDLPTSIDFDGDASITATAESADGFLGRDRIRIHYDTIVPEIHEGQTEVTNVDVDGQLDELCLLSDCDIESFVLHVEGGDEVTLDTDKATQGECVDDVRQYCFKDAFLGIPNSEEIGEIEVTVRAIDDQGNPSEDATFTTKTECKLSDKFVGERGGLLTKTITLPDGTPAVAWTDGRRLRYAERAEDGSWSRNEAVVFNLPNEDGRDRFGLGFDLALDPQSGRPAVCLTEAHLSDDQTEATATATLRVREPGDGGAWDDVGTVADVRPMGCAMTAHQGELAVAWIEPDPNADKELTSRAVWGRLFGDFGLFPQFELPRPKNFQKNLLLWDVDLASHEDRLFFAYRAAVPMLAPAPGAIVAGQVGDDRQDPVARQVRFQSCGSNQPPPGAGPVFGAAPRIAVTDSTVHLVFVEMLDDLHRLQWLESDVPDPGKKFSFKPLLPAPVGFPSREDFLTEFAPVTGFRTDGLTTQLSGAKHPIVDFFYSPPDIAARGDRAVVAYAHGGFKAGREEIDVLERRDDGTIKTDVVEARVGSVPQRRHVVIPSIALGPHGYGIAFPNPVAGRVVFTDELSSPLFASEDPLACKSLYRDITLDESLLNLEYPRRSGGTDVLWQEACFPPGDFPERPVAFPFRAGPANLIDVAFDDENFNGLFEEILTGVKLRTGFPPLKKQSHVCVPDGGLSACKSRADTVPLQPSIMEASSNLGPPEETFFSSIEEADEACSHGGQVVVDLTRPGVFCAECPEGAFYDPASDACLRCIGTGQPVYQNRPAGLSPRLLLSGVDSASCRRCVPVDDEKLERGAMPLLLTSDGSHCNRCVDGSRPTACSDDLDCQSLNGGGVKFRCSDSTDWNGRANAPDQRVCVPKCESDADCPVGSCVQDGDDKGACKVQDPLLGAFEVPSGLDLGCRPIGCDECWQNDICLKDNDCPLNHHCETEETLAPLCLLRPLLAPRAVAALPIPPDDRPDIEEAIEGFNRALTEFTRGARLPPNFLSGTVTDFHATISGARVKLKDPPPGGNQGRIAVKLDLSDVSFELLETPFTVPGASVEFRFEPHVEPPPPFEPPDDGEADTLKGFGPAFGGMNAVAVSVDVDGGTTLDKLISVGLTALGFPAEAIFLEAAGRTFGRLLPEATEPTLLNRLAPISIEMLSSFLRIIGNVTEDGSPGPLRCTFMKTPEQARNELPRLCPDGELEAPQLVRVRDGEIDVTLKECLDE